MIKISGRKGQEQEQGIWINVSCVRTRGEDESLVRSRSWTLGCYFVFLLRDGIGCSTTIIVDDYGKPTLSFVRSWFFYSLKKLHFPTA